MDAGQQIVDAFARQRQQAFAAFDRTRILEKEVRDLEYVWDEEREAHDLTRRALQKTRDLVWSYRVVCVTSVALNVMLLCVLAFWTR